VYDKVDRLGVRQTFGAPGGSASGKLVLRSDVGKNFRAVTDSGEIVAAEVLKAEIGVDLLPGTKITLAKKIHDLSPGDLHLLARDLGVEVAYVEEAGKRFLYIGESATKVTISPHPNATRILHVQPNNPMISASDVAAFKGVTNPNCVFEVVTETVGDSRKLFTVSYTQEEVQRLAGLAGESQADEILYLAWLKMIDKGVSFAE
jgi:hypothetical protein